MMDNDNDNDDDNDNDNDDVSSAGQVYITKYLNI